MSDAAVGDPFGTELPLDTVLSHPRPGTVLLQVAGEVDTLTAPRFEADLNAGLDAAAAVGAALVLDLTAVTFLASSGLAVLIHGARRATTAGGRLHVVAATRSVSRPMSVTGADGLVDTYDDLESALAAVPPGIAPPAGGVGR